MKIIEKIKAVWFDKVTCRKLPKEKGYKWVRATGSEGSWR